MVLERRRYVDKLQYFNAQRHAATQVGTCYPRESIREGLCNHRSWFVCLFVCLFVCYHDSLIKRGRIWTKFFGKVLRVKSKPKFVSGYDR